ncbi:MAG: hypothetical protein KAH32_07725 [Chlamydiia bacterium]|nr:hypothetical protein [Chlamydiia bacterium]
MAELTQELINEYTARFEHPTVPQGYAQIDDECDTLRSELEAIVDDDGNHLLPENIEEAITNLKLKKTKEFESTSMKGLSAWVKVPYSFLDTVVPSIAHWSQIGVVDDNGDPVMETAIYEETGVEYERQVLRQKNIREYICVWDTSNDGTEAMFSLCAMEYAVYRYAPNTPKDIHDWFTLLPMYGISLDNIMNLDERKVLLQTTEWKMEGGMQWE